MPWKDLRYVTGVLGVSPDATRAGRLCGGASCSTNLPHEITKILGRGCDFL